MNSGEASAGGIIFDTRGNKVLTYSWGLGRKTNNEVEWLALLFWMEQIKHNKITKVTVLGDSIQVIRKMISRYNKGGVKIWRIYDRIRKTYANIQTPFIHILRSNNSEADIWENQGDKLKTGISRVNVILKTSSYVP